MPSSSSTLSIPMVGRRRINLRAVGCGETLISPKKSIPMMVDRISELPDSILHHILSFLPTTKDAATTTFLSKRWKSVWLSLLTLHFDTEPFKHFATFQKFVYSTLFELRQKNDPIHSFTLKCTKPSDFTQRQFNQILKFVKQRGIQILNFHMQFKNHIVFDFPSIILSFNTLVVLKLANLKIRIFDDFNFPYVKTLHLDGVCFLSPRYVEMFLLGFPVLQDFSTISLFIDTPNHYPVTLNPLPNLVKGRVCDGDIGINTVLKFFSKAQIMQVEKFKSWPLSPLPRFPVFHNLTHMELSFHIEIRDESFQLLEIFSCFPKLQHFIIQHMCIGSGCWKRPDTVPECLLSQLKTCSIRGFSGDKHELKFAKYVIKHSQVLETMKIRSPFIFIGKAGGLKNRTKMKLSSCKKGSSTCKILFD